jgi:hypothetical protein
MPQYLASKSAWRTARDAFKSKNLRASVGGKLLLLLGVVQPNALHAFDGNARLAFLIIVVENLGLVVLIVVTSSRLAGSTALPAGTEGIVEKALIRVDSGQIVGAVGRDRRGGIGNQVVSDMRENPLHVGGRKE